MAFDSSKLQIGTRDQLPNFVIFEETSPTRRSRIEVPVKAGETIYPGDLIDSTGAKVALSATTAATGIVGIALTAYSDKTFAGLTREGDIKIAALGGGYSEVKDYILKGATTEVLTQIAKLGIVVVPCGL